MSHAQKPDFVFRRNGRVHLNRRGRQFSRPLAAEVCASAVVMLDTPCSEVAWRVLATHSIRQFPPSLPLPCVTVCHHVSTGLLQRRRVWGRRSSVASLYVQEIGLFIGGSAVNKLYKTCTTYLSVFRNCVMLPNMGCVEPRKDTIRLPSTTLGKCLADFFSNSSHVKLNRKSGSHYENNQHDALYGLIYYSKSALRVSGDFFAHHQEHLTVFIVSGSVLPSCCRLVSWMS
jgi:hypothetical protein